MSLLKNKSDFNLEAAKVLINDHDNYPPSVHCSYYGCFQFIKSKLNSLGHTYEKMDQAIASSGNVLHSNTYPISLMIQELKNKGNDKGIYAQDVKDKIKKLKAFRTMSDYHNEMVDFNKSKIALALSHEIINLIKKKI